MSNSNKNSIKHIRSTESEPTISDYEQFIGALKDVNEFNSQNSVVGVAINSAVQGLFSALKRGELESLGLSEDEALEAETIVSENQEEVHQNQNIGEAVLHLTTKSQLNAAGLNPAPLKRLSSEGRPDRPGSVAKVGLWLEDGAIFCNFIEQSIDKAPEEFANVVPDVVEELAKEAYLLIRDDEDLAPVHQLLVYGDSINSAIAKLGRPESNLLQSLSMHAKENTLTEFVVANESGILNEVSDNNFGPSIWQRDISADGLHQNWSKIIGAIQFVANNSNAQNFAAEITELAKEHLAYAKADLDKLVNAGQYPKNYSNGFTEIFQLVEMQLADIQTELKSP